MNDEEVFELCKGVFRNDKTTYQYPNNCTEEEMEKAENRFGLKPGKGKRWNSPSEMAEAFVKNHFPDRHQELYE